MSQKNITAEELIEVILAAGHKPRSYSGRMMFGEKCVSMIFRVGSDDHGIPRGNLVDTHAFDQVWYWPDMEWPPGAIDHDEDDDEDGE